MHYRIACGCLVLLMLVHGSVWGEVYRIDFGTEDSPVRTGFVGVTAGATGGAVGWVETGSLEAVDHPVPRTPFPPVIYTTDLRQDSVQGAGPATLRVRTAPGVYRVWAMVGTGGGDWGQVWDIQITDPTRGDKAVATFIGGQATRVLELDVATDAAGNLDIEISTRSRWSINAMVIAPVGEWPALEAEIERLNREVLILPDDVLKNWKHTPHEPSDPAIEFTPAERERGFVIYARPWVTPIWPNSRPGREELDPTLKAFLSPGEYEPVTFTLLPLRSLEEVEVVVSDLQNENGATLPAADIEVRHVRYKIVRPNYKTFGSYYRAPDLLPRLDAPQTLTPEENFRVWLTLHAKPGTVPGIYRGHARVRLGGQEAAQVPMLVRVLPIELAKDPSITYSTYYRHPSRYLKEAPDEFSRQWWQTKIQADLVSMVAHGYNSFRPDISAGFDSRGRAVANLEKWQGQVEAARAHGMDIDRPAMGDVRPAIGSLYRQHMGKDYGLHLYNVEMPGEGFFEQVTQLVAAVEAERQVRGLPELLYSLVDEPAATDASIAFTRRVYEAAKKVPGIRTYVTVDPGREGYESLHGVIDVWSSPYVNRPNVDRAALAARGIEVWCYPNAIAGENDHTPVAGARMTYGFARWREGVPGLIPWIFESWGGDPENNLDSLQSDMFNHTTDDAQVLPCTLYEAYREGIDDNRYLTTLEQAIQRARSAGLSDEAEAAEADLAFVREAVPVRDIYQYDTGWTDDSFDVYRWVLARRILRLNDALNGRP